MGADASSHPNSIKCPEAFRCWYESDMEASPQKDMTEEGLIFDIDVKELLQSNKQKERQIHEQFIISPFLAQLNSNSFHKKSSMELETRVEKHNPDEMEEARTCKRQLFLKKDPWRNIDSADTNEYTVTNKLKELTKEDKENIPNFNLNSHIVFERKDSNFQQPQRLQESPSNRPSRLISLDSDFLTLNENSNHHRTPSSESWKHFLSSIDRTKFLRSNQGESKFDSLSKQKTRQLINYLNSNYIGNIEVSIPNGYGEIRYQNGDTLCGYFENNLCEGKGKYIKKDGSLYQGDFIHGQACGNGTYYGSDGYRYEGQWKNNKPSGRGKAVYSDLSIYEGEFLEGKRHGNGTFIQNGCKFVGEFKNDEVDGTAIFFADNGETYNGEWKRNVKEGFGEYRWMNGDRYVGSYRNDKREGYGAMYYQNGDAFAGNWRNGMKNGEGVYTSSTQTISGSWVRSQYVGAGMSS